MNILTQTLINKLDGYREHKRKHAQFVVNRSDQNKQLNDLKEELEELINDNANQ